VAFRATLEELESADLLLHVIDAANPAYESHIQSVVKILEELDLDDIPIVPVLNKMDLIDEETMAQIINQTGGIAISAQDIRSLNPLIDKLETMIHSNDIRVNRTSDAETDKGTDSVKALEI